MKYGIIGLALVAAAIAAGPAPAQNRTLVWADAGEPMSIDPAKANIDWELNVTRNVYDGLTTYSYDNPGEILPALATRWEREGKVWTFTLRDGVTFHDGQPFTAEDVKATIDRMLSIGQGGAYLIDDITSVTVVDPLTVKIETAEPNVYLVGNLSHIEIVSAADIAAHADDDAQAFLGENANGTGPYKFDGWTRGSQIVLIRNVDWWGEFPDKPFDRVIDRFVAEGSTRARGLEGGEFDLANYVPLDESLRIGLTDGFSLVEGNNLWAWPAIYLNSKLAPTDNPKIREALVKSFDHEAMVGFLNGYASVPRGPVPDYFPDSPENELAPIAQDMEGAKAAYEASGLSNPTMKCVIPSGFAEFAFAATVLQATAAEIGISVQVEQAPFAEAIAASKNGTSNCFAIGNANLAPTDATKFLAAHFAKGGFYNSANYDNPEFDALVTRISSVTDDAERYDLLKQAIQTVIDADIAIWTARPTTVFAVPDKIQGMAVNPSDYTGVRFWTLSSAD